MVAPCVKLLPVVAPWDKCLLGMIVCSWRLKVVAPWVTLVTAAAATATALHLVKLRSTKMCVYDN